MIQGNYTSIPILPLTIDDEEAGNYRRVNGGIAGANHIPPQSIKVPRLLEEFIEWYFENDRELSISKMTAELHYRFVMIHPFIDGNGRVARRV